MHYIKAPFNFVPVSEHVYFPDRAGQISHDVPFSDGLTGQLTIEITAKTPIFIRDSEDRERFCHVKDKEGTPKFFIPGTSLKGTIRSVMEILSFGKMDKINDHKYAIRDLYNREVYNLMGDSANIHCGWLQLVKDEDGTESAKIRDCGTPWRISHQQLDAALGTNFVSTFRQGSTANFRGTSPHKTAKYKYTVVAAEVTLTKNFVKTTDSYGRKLCDFDSSGDEGTLVFTGQAGARKTAPRPSGKFYEFVFVEQNNPATIEVDAKTWEEFKFHYFDHDPKNISADWKWRKRQLENGNEIPVFFRLDPEDHSKVKDLGLSYLYKMPYKYSVKELLPQEHRLPFYKPDLAECIFGYATETEALKGRVQFSHAWAKTNVKEDRLYKTVLGTPRASYYPIYIKQKGSDGSVESRNNRPVYKTYMDDDAELAGHKRYVLRENNLDPLPAATENMGVSFRPLESRVVFTGKINYFNLRPAELGALLSALTFHNNADKCYHGLGMAKPYGFGRVSVKIAEGMDDEPLKNYLEEFEKEVTAFMQADNPGFSWYQSEQVKQFIALSKVQKIEDDRNRNRLKYMQLPEFAQAKNRDNGFYLNDHISISGDSGSIESLITTEIGEEIKERAEQVRDGLKKEIEKAAEEEKTRKEAIKRAEKIKKAEKETTVREAAEKARQEKLKKEQEEEQKRLEEERKKQEAILKEIEQRKLAEEERIKEQNGILKENGLGPLLVGITDFKRTKKTVDYYMKHTGVDRLDERDINAVLEKAQDWYLSTRKKYREKRWKPGNGPDWRKLAFWVGKDKATEWFNKIEGKL